MDMFSDRWLAARVILILGLIGIAGCTAHYPVNDSRTGVVTPQSEERYTTNNRELRGPSEELMVVLTFSGGGTRAAAFSYGVLEELAQTKIRTAGHEARLLDEIDAISSVSGGSFTAAYFGLFGDRIFEDFEEKFLKVDVQGKLTRGVFSPFSWVKLGSPWYGRSELAADLYDRLLFENKTYRDLLAAGSPAVLINATDVALGAQFTFGDGQFALLCSDLMSFPVSRAVTASSAVPLLFNSVVLQNHTGECDLRLPEWVQAIITDGDRSSRQYNHAELKLSYLDREERPFIHLHDGGLSDNLGVRTLLDSVFLRGGAWEAIQRAGLQHTNKLIVILVNAEANIDLSSAKKGYLYPYFRHPAGGLGGAPQSLQL